VLISCCGMSASEKFCLKWNNFQENISTAFGSLREDNDFSDVTLACEDGHQVEAHRVILAASSPFFQDLLRRNKHPHPLIYMRGMKADALVAVVDFLYYGEANIYQENLDVFLAIAEELKLKGLVGSGATDDIKEDKDIPKPIIKKTKQSEQKEMNLGLNQRSYQQQSTSVPSDHNSDTVPQMTVATLDNSFSGEFQELECVFTGNISGIQY
jgi:hypothetical protein